jgi:hypothetical protein
MTGIVMRHPAVAINPDAHPDRSPAGPLFFTSFHTEKTEEAFRAPVQRMLRDMLLVKPNLTELRPFYDSKPAVIFTDQDKALMNGVGQALNGFGCASMYLPAFAGLHTITITELVQMGRLADLSTSEAQPSA